jgi:hypothetical protein
MRKPYEDAQPLTGLRTRKPTLYSHTGHLSVVEAGSVVFDLHWLVILHSSDSLSPLRDHRRYFDSLETRGCISARLESGREV